ncbi:unnamed protein product [Urochloa humidicola]
MESQAKNGSPSPLIRRRVEASIVCLDTPPQTEPADIGGGGDPELALLLQCRVTQYIRSGRGRGQRHVRSYRGGVGAEASFVGTVPRDTPLDEDNIRGVIWGLLRDIRPLHDLDLTDAEWEAILPEDVVPRLAGLARGLLEDGGGRVAAVLELEVNCHVRYNVPRVLLTACRETATPGGKGGGGECSICFEALREEDGRRGRRRKRRAWPWSCQGARTRSTAGAFRSGSVRNGRALCAAGMWPSTWTRTCESISRCSATTTIWIHVYRLCWMHQEMSLRQHRHVIRERSIVSFHDDAGLSES